MVMKLQLQRTYEVVYENDEEVQKALFDAVTDGYNIAITDEQWNMNVEDGIAEGTWDEVGKEQEEALFYSYYPKDEVGVEFPPKTIEDLARIQAWDMHKNEIGVDDVFYGSDDADDVWFVVDKDSNEVPRALEVNY
jgi:hypothetical protein